MTRLSPLRIAALRAVAARYSTNLWECAARIIGGSPDPKMQYRMKDLIETIEKREMKTEEQPVEKFVRRLLARLSKH